MTSKKKTRKKDEDRAMAALTREYWLRFLNKELAKQKDQPTEALQASATPGGESSKLTIQ